MVSECLSADKTTLITEDENKGQKFTNFRPVLHLPLIWKLVTRPLTEKTYERLNKGNLATEKQKGCLKKFRGAIDQLLIDRTILRIYNRRRTGLTMAWID